MLRSVHQSDLVVIQTPIGPLGIRMRDESIAGVDFLPPGTASTALPTGFAERVVRQFEDYFDHRLQVFDLPLTLGGTAFQKRVWRALQAIPFGETRTYGELAEALQTSARAIGGACRGNPVPLVVPCHRIIAANGALGGFAGDSVGGQTLLKSWLLRHECVPGWAA